MLKGLPATYNRDLQEDKEALFDSVDTVRHALEVWSAMLPEVRIKRAQMEAAARDPNLLATDLAEHLVKKGVPFREAHELVGKLVTRAAGMKVALNKFPDRCRKFRRLLAKMSGPISTPVVPWKAAGDGRLRRKM